MTKTKEYCLSRHVTKLLLEEPFFAAISRVVPKLADRSIPTAGVRIKEDGNYEMSYNTEWFSTLTSDQTLDVLKHELYHIIFEHLTTRKPVYPTGSKMPRKQWHDITNVAMDLSINTHLNNLPLLPSGSPACKPGAGAFESYPANKSMELYLKMLLSQVDEAAVSTSGLIDDHSEPSPESEKLAKEKMKTVITQAFEDCESHHFGSLSKQVKDEVRKSMSSDIDWRKMLRYFVKTSQSANKASSIKRINKRYPYIHSGRKISRTVNIAVSIDQSYSVDDDMLSSFFAELNNLAEIADFTVVPFDHEVAEDQVYVWRKGERKKYKRVLSGGTCFNAPTDYVNKRGFDGHIILTDLAAPKPKASKCQRMWITNKRCASMPFFTTNERIVVIT